MMPPRKKKLAPLVPLRPSTLENGYNDVLKDVIDLLEKGRGAVVQSVNATMTATYWLIGRRIVEEEQLGESRARYGTALMERLAHDLTRRFGRGFSVTNLEQMRRFYQGWQIPQTVSGKSTSTISWECIIASLRLSWSHYIELMQVKDRYARKFYETEALRGGWSIRQLKRQIGSQFFERTALSRNKAAMLKKGSMPKPEDAISPEEEIKDPYILEFLNLKDEYSESDLEEPLIRHLESFLLELGGDFAFIGRQRRLRIGDEWCRVDLLFYHRGLRCLIVIELKLDKLTHADAGQMHMYLNYALEHWTRPDENPPIGLILCAKRNEALARYALAGLPNKVLTAEYRTEIPNEYRIALPEEKLIEEEIVKTRKLLERRKK